MSWPASNTLMIEPTESESKMELDKFQDAMISIKSEIDAVKDPNDNPLRGAPHTAVEISFLDDWKHSYSRMSAAYSFQTY